MKKHLIAAAVAAAVAAPAMAQNVTVYGILDVGVSEQTTKSGGATTAKTKTTGEGGAYTTQRLGVRGEEDLGGGLKATFNFEMGLGANGGVADRARTSTGEDETTLADYKADESMGTTVIRQSNIGLAGGFGSVRVGRMTTLADAVYGLGDVGGGNNFRGRTYSGSTASSSSNTTNLINARSDRLIEYVSPSINGFTLGVQYGSKTSEATSGSGKGTETGASLRYSAGPLNVGLGYQKHKDKIGTADGRESAVVLLAGNYNFGVAQVFVNYQDGDIERDYGTATPAAPQTAYEAPLRSGQKTERKVTEIGVAVPMGAWRLAGSYYDGTNKDRTSAANALAKSDLSGFQLAALYSLSKRTTVYAVYGEAESKPTSGNRAEVSDMGVGIRHSF